MQTADRAKAALARVDAYRATFLHASEPALLPMAELVLADLRRACCADRPTTVLDRNGAVDPIATAMNEGKRQVWLRIVQPLALPDAVIFRMVDAAQKIAEE